MSSKSIKEKYNKEVISQMKREFKYENNLAVPKVEKIVLNIGLGRGLTDKNFVEIVKNTLRRITGQNPILTKAKKSISAFKIRKGMIVGIKVTLRGHKMNDFLTKLVYITFPRLRDFYGMDISKKYIDKKGNFSFGFKEHVVFPEIKADEVEHIHGLELAMSTTADTKAECYFLLKYLGFPFIIDEELENKFKEEILNKNLK